MATTLDQIRKAFQPTRVPVKVDSTGLKRYFFKYPTDLQFANRALKAIPKPMGSITLNDPKFRFMEKAEGAPTGWEAKWRGPLQIDAWVADSASPALDASIAAFKNDMKVINQKVAARMNEKIRDAFWKRVASNSPANTEATLRLKGALPILIGRPGEHIPPLAEVVNSLHFKSHISGMGQVSVDAGEAFNEVPHVWWCEFGRSKTRGAFKSNKAVPARSFIKEGTQAALENINEALNAPIIHIAAIMHETEGLDASMYAQFIAMRSDIWGRQVKADVNQMAVGVRNSINRQQQHVMGLFDKVRNNLAGKAYITDMDALGNTIFLSTRGVINDIIREEQTINRIMRPRAPRIWQPKYPQAIKSKAAHKPSTKAVAILSSHYPERAPVEHARASAQAVSEPMIHSWAWLWWVLPPSHLWAIIGATQDILSVFKGTLLQPEFAFAWLKAYAMGAMGVSKKVWRRRLRQRMWYWR